MNYCKVCGRCFQYATSSLPYDICPECYNEHVTIVEIIPTQEEQLKQCYNIINTCLEQNEKHQKEIKDNNETIAYYYRVISELNDAYKNEF